MQLKETLIYMWAIELALLIKQVYVFVVFKFIEAGESVKSWHLLLGTYPKELKTCPHKNLHMGVYSSSFIHNCQNLEATQMCFSRWLHK